MLNKLSMLRKVSILLLFPVLMHAQEIVSIGMLFDSLKTHQQTRADELLIEQANAGKGIAYSHLVPNLDLIGRYDYYSTATGMLPLPLNEMFTMIKDPTLTQPFSHNVYRLGAAISMPLFAKSIYTMASRASMMAKSAEDKKYIDLLKNEAMLVSLNANLAYMDALGGALDQKRSSMLKTKEFVVLKVNNGRAPEAALIKINDGLNEIDVMKNDLALQREDVIAAVRNLTGVVLASPLPMTKAGSFAAGDMKALDPLKEKLEADRLAHRAEVEKLYPMIALQGNFSRAYAKAYNNDKEIYKNYYTVGIVLKIPLLAFDQYAEITKSSVEMEATQNDLDRTKLELESQSAQLLNSLPIIERSIELFTKSIADKKQLLAIARVSYQSDQMTMEDYLKYEDDLVLEQSKLFKAQAQQWQTIVKLAVIYGNNIEEIVR